MTDPYAGYEALAFDRPHPRVMRVTIDREERLNALDARGHRELTYVWNDIDRDPTVNAVILRGRGRAFSAGGDFAMIEDVLDDFNALTGLWKEARDLVYNIANCNKPIVSAITGPCVGAGLAAALLADISIATPGAKIVDGHTRLGVAAGDHSVLIWPLLCGMAKAKYYLMLCEPIDGTEAERIGLVSRLVAEEELEAVSLDIATRLAEGSPSAIRFTKYALNNVLRMFGPAFDASTALEMLGFTGPDPRESLAARKEKRPAAFSPDSPL